MAVCHVLVIEETLNMLNKDMKDKHKKYPNLKVDH